MSGRSRVRLDPGRMALLKDWEKICYWMQPYVYIPSSQKLTTLPGRTFSENSVPLTTSKAERLISKKRS